MTRTITSNAPGSGTSISSIWNASRGSPSRSWRITHAAIVSGSVPGSVPTSVTFLMSTAISPPGRVRPGSYLGDAERLGGLGPAGGLGRKSGPVLGLAAALGLVLAEQLVLG